MSSETNNGNPESEEKSQNDVSKDGGNPDSVVEKKIDIKDQPADLNSKKDQPADSKSKKDQLADSKSKKDQPADSKSRKDQPADSKSKKDQPADSRLKKDDSPADSKLKKEDQPADLKSKKEYRPVDSESEKGSDEDDEREVGLLDRPVEVSGSRDRKKVQRLELSFNVTTKDKLEIPEGTGEKFGECPRIEHQLQRNSINELKLLHRILFARQGSGKQFKSNIRKFSGFTFEKGSSEYDKKKTVLEKATMTNLKHICEVIDIERGGTKEEIIIRILDFLLEPKASGKPVPQAKKKVSSKGQKRKSKSGEKSKAVKKPKVTNKNSDVVKDDSDNEADSSEEDKASSKKQKGKSKNGEKSKATKKPKVNDKDSDVAEDDSDDKSASSEDEKKTSSKGQKRKIKNGEKGKAAKKSKVTDKDSEEDEDDSEPNSSDEKKKVLSKQQKRKSKSDDKSKTRKKSKVTDKDSDVVDDDSDDKPDSSNGENSDAEVEVKKSKATPKKAAPPKRTASRKSKLSAKKKTVSTDDSSSDDDEPLVKIAKSPPSNEEIKSLVKKILKGADLQEITMKKVIKQVFEAFPDFDMSSKKDFVKAAVKSVIS